MIGSLTPANASRSLTAAWPTPTTPRLYPARLNVSAATGTEQCGVERLLPRPDEQIEVVEDRARLTR